MTNTVVIPLGGSFSVDDIAISGVSKVETLPQYRAGWALKICRPLISRTSKQIALSQWVTRDERVAKHPAVGGARPRQSLERSG